MITGSDAEVWGRLLGIAIGGGIVIGLVMRAFRSGWWGE